MRLKIIIAGLLTGLIAFIPMTATADENATIRFIVTGDLYELNADKGRGGYAKLASVAKIFKKKTKREIHSFLVHVGDAYSPSLLSTMDKGKSAVEMLNAVGVDYMVLGNHEWISALKYYVNASGSQTFQFWPATPEIKTVYL